MRLSIKFLRSAWVVCTAFASLAFYGNPVQATALNSSAIHTPADTMDASKKMRVVFIPNSTYKNFKIGIESNVKTDVNIQVINQKGMVVYSDLIENVSKKLEEVDFSFLKKGEYTVKVTNQQDAYTKTLVIP
ncbi:T9SS type A sorting domain-containing protein [Rhodocytophaga rosea]|uniref:T9SS type A sorting domain-containing protein n=1 Tax=Rhodocytophaga rosea TaxID=2704465 RepID=A0A6C0GG20_9BACT|nr:T9SS type A sorting domain-containing protein [Rhodocytophaga rosea]QHT66733.1 T9SS type A sorting domain-containing protein [Rhodocytophaga rosea]